MKNNSVGTTSYNSLGESTTEDDLVSPFWEPPSLSGGEGKAFGWPCLTFPKVAWQLLTREENNLKKGNCRNHRSFFSSLDAKRVFFLGRLGSQICETEGVTFQEKCHATNHSRAIATHSIVGSPSPKENRQSIMKGIVPMRSRDLHPKSSGRRGRFLAILFWRCVKESHDLVDAT